MRLGGVALRETGEQVLKRLSKESDHIGDAIRAQARPFTEAIVKEMDEAPYKIPDWETWYRNDLGRVQIEGNDLLQGRINKQAVNDLNWLPDPRIEEHPDHANFFAATQKKLAANQTNVNQYIVISLE